MKWRKSIKNIAIRKICKRYFNMKMSKSEKKTINGLLRKLIYARDGERCLHCNKTERLQMSHIYPKGRYRRMEFDPDNLKLLCYYCHLQWWHKNPIESHEWLQTVIPKKRLDRLKLCANTVNKSPFDFKLYKIFLEKEISSLSISRNLCQPPRLQRPSPRS